MSSVFRALHRAHAAARMPRRALLSTIPPRATFDAAVHALEVSGTELDDQQKLRLYGLFKAASGAEAGARPSAFNLVGRAKWDAWDAVAKTMTQDEACIAYAKEVESIVGPIGDETPPPHGLFW